MNDVANWKLDEPVRADAEKFIIENELTHSEFTSRLGRSFTTTRITKYLNLDKPGNKPENDAPKVEAAIRQFLRHISRGKNLRQSLFENSVTKDMDTILRQIRRTGDVGAITSMAGQGKTCGAHLHYNDNPNTIYTVARRPYACSDNALLKMLLDEYLDGSDEHYDGSNVGLWLEKRLRGSERLWIIDDAELLHMAAVKTAISLHDATGIAIAFIANDEFITKLRNADLSGKLISRIGIRHEVRRGNDDEFTAQKLIEQFAPASGDALVDHVVDTLSEFGHCRRARKQLTLASNIYQGQRDKDWPKAYVAAGLKLVSAANPRKTRI